MTQVTALVSAYFAEPFIERRLKNLEQLLPPPEILVVCQLHSIEYDYTVQHLNKYPQRYDIYTTEDIPTIYKAWNVGITWAKGDYLTSANCDDFTYPNGLYMMSRYLDAHPEIDLVYGDCDLLDEKGIREWKRGESDLEKGINRIGAMPMWRKSLHDRFGLFDERMKVSGDYEFWRRCVQGGAKIAHLDKTVGLYWKRADSLEHRNKRRMKAENMVIRGMV